MPVESRTLRERAEELLARDPDMTPAMPTSDMQTLVRELQLRETELEISNEELRAAEKELAASRDRYAELYDSAPAGYLTLDGHDRIVGANLPAGRMLSVSRDCLVNSHKIHGFRRARGTGNMAAVPSIRYRERWRQAL